jgi:uncharacterized protein YndB with AHSA1/START domain
MKTIHFTVVINAPIDKVWKVITTKEGVTSYMAPNVHVGFNVGDPYEIYFDPEQEKGLKGSEGMKVLCMEPMTRFGFTWNNPPSIPDIRGQQTTVYYELEAHGTEKTTVKFYNTGFGDSKDWVDAYGYFVRAWGMIVLPKLVYACEVGPYPWDQELDLSEYVERIV